MLYHERMGTGVVGTSTDPASRDTAPALRGGASLERLRTQLRGWALAGFWFAAASAVLGVLSIPIILTSPDRVPLLALCGVNVVVSGLLAYGMWATHRFRSYGLALCTALASIVPWSGYCVMVSIGIGGVCLALLAQRGAAQLFPAGRVARIPDALPLAALITSGLALCFFPAGPLGAALGVWVLARGGPELDPGKRRLAVAAAAVGVGAFVFSGLITMMLLPLFLMP